MEISPIGRLTIRAFRPGVGGAMDLAVGAKEIRVLLEHTTKSGAPRVRRRCEYPLTAAGAVSRIYTDLAVIDVTREGLVVREIAEDIDGKLDENGKR